ncbi:ATP-binding cassette domain-containing protein [Actinotalea ferrariae]|nr:ATP-binding cassette domain-containing protein [Actinotalea ferrariae]
MTTDGLGAWSRTPVLSLRQVTRRYRRVEALDAVDLDVHAREVVALVGDNGAGKSTLARVVAGVEQPDAGFVEMDGAPVTISSPGAAHALGIATVFQDPALCDNLSVVANLFLGRELRVRPGGPLDEERMVREARQILDDLTTGITSVHRTVNELSNGQRQAITIARAMITRPRVVVLDEPTAALSVVQTAEVLQLVTRLREMGLGVVLISHDLADVLAVADRVEVLRHGRNNGSFDAASSSQEEIVAAITGAPGARGRAFR